MAGVDSERSRKDIRDMFYRWGVDKGQYEIIWQEEIVGATKRRLPGVSVRYLHQRQWQTVSSYNLATRSLNLRNIFLFLDRIRIAENKGIQYQNLTFTTDIVQADQVTSERANKEDLEDAFDFLGVTRGDPPDLVDRVYKAKAQSYHPDKGGNAEMMARLNEAYRIIQRSYGGPPR
ncbi:MAG: J domain-containing protein [Dehalococcoidales bacterium]|nr:J domain-containing protein [Dehalococcoidales bacterium]